MWQSVLSLEMWAWLLGKPKNSRIPHSLPESNQYHFNHEGCWNGELTALGYCSHIPKDISWAVKNWSEPNGPFSERFDCQLLGWRHTFFLRVLSFSQLKSKSWFFAWPDWLRFFIFAELRCPQNQPHPWRGGHVMCVLISLNYVELQSDLSGAIYFQLHVKDSLKTMSSLSLALSGSAVEKGYQVIWSLRK